MNYFSVVAVSLLCLLLVCCGNVSDGGAIEVEVFAEGKLVMPSGDPASGAVVQINEEGSSAKRSTETNNEGYYRFDSLLSGTYELSASHEVDTVQYVYSEGDILVPTSGINLGVDTLLELGYITGFVGLPINDLSGSDCKLLGDSPSATTDSSGFFLMRNVPVGKSYTLRISHRGYFSFDTTVTIINHGDTISLDSLLLKRDPSVPVEPPVGLSYTYTKETQEVTLRWNSVDDPILAGYRVFRRLKDGDIDNFDTLSGKTLVTDTLFIDTILPAQESELTFLYQLKSWDSYNNASINYSTAVEVTVNPEVPSKPNAPIAPYPGEQFRYGAVGESLPFRFTGGPEKMFDSVTYTILFDTLNPPVETLFTDLTVPSFSNSLDDSSQTYFWQVIATNGEGSVTGPVWSIQSETAYRPDKMAFIPSTGKNFTMGYAGGESTDMTKEHEVSFTYDFYMDSTEVSQTSFNAYMYYHYSDKYQKPRWTNPYDSDANDNIHPAYSVSWFDAVLYCNAQSQEYGLDSVYIYDKVDGTICYGATLLNITADTSANGFRLPTEAEWEFAAGDGKETLFPWGDHFESKSYYVGNSSGTSNNFWGYRNQWGVLGLIGNVSEWCHDIYIVGDYEHEDVTDPYGVAGDLAGDHVIRGGNFTSDTTDMMIHRRFFAPADSLQNSVGFRMVLPQKRAWRGEELLY